VTAAWYGILALMFAGFAVGEGWNFGAGALHLFVARTRAERRQVVAAIGPLWSWNEVWLIAAGGVLVMAFPRVFAAAMSGYYLAVFLLLWCLVLRGIALEVGGHLDDAMWQDFWNVIFAASSAALAVLFGAAFGNLLRGVPLDADGRMFLPLFDDLGRRGRVGILDWFTISVAVFTLVLLAAHGATGLARRTAGALEVRSARAAARLWIATVVLLPVVSIETAIVRPGFFTAITERPLGQLSFAVVVAGLGAVLAGTRRRAQTLAFVGSSAVILGLIAGAAASMYPVMLQSTIEGTPSITAENGAADVYALRVALGWWPVALALSVGYAAFVGWRYRGKVAAEPEGR